jgi:hypothetical protein
LNDGNLQESIARMIAMLRDEIAHIDHAIQTLVELQHESPLSRLERRRGRKSMSVTERAQVSARMRRYWEKRRDDGEGNQ